MNLSEVEYFLQKAEGLSSTIKASPESTVDDKIFIAALVNKLAGLKGRLELRERKFKKTNE
jgi:hypothetical protein